MPERLRDRAVVIRAADLFVVRARDANEMIARDPALLRVEPGQLFRFRNALVENDDRVGRERLICARPRDERENKAGNPQSARQKCSFKPS